MAETNESFRQRVATFLELDRRRILLNWASRVGALPAFRQRPDLDLAAVLDEMPTIFDDLIALIRRTDVAPPNPDLGAAAVTVIAHARERMALGFRASDLVQEYQQLRQTIWAEIRDHAADLAPTVEEMFDFGYRLNYRIDAIVVVTLETLEPPATPA